MPSSPHTRPTPCNVLLFIWTVYCGIQARVLGWVVFLSGILHFPSWVTVCIPLMLPLSWEVILQWSYWSHSPWRTWTWPCPSSWPSCIEGGKVGCGKQEDCEACLGWGAGNTSDHVQSCAQITTLKAHIASWAGAKVIPAAWDCQGSRKNLS